jgi:hypothetical protein
MTGDELLMFDLQVGLFSKYPKQEGLFHADIMVKPGGRTVRFTYYSRHLRRLFVVGAHLVRHGEPRDWDKQQMDEYIRAIQEWELNPGSDPETFGVSGGD